MFIIRIFDDVSVVDEVSVVWQDDVIVVFVGVDLMFDMVDGVVVFVCLYGELFFKLLQDFYIFFDVFEVFFEMFEGLFDLLLYLICKQNFNVFDILMVQVIV